MSTCPAGHQSSTDDYCDVCGVAMAAGTAAGTGTSKPALSATPSLACANCGTAHEPADVFCEVCGLDFTTGQLPAAPPPPAPAPVFTTAAGATGGSPATAGGPWTVTIEVDKAFFDTNSTETPGSTIALPADRRPRDISVVGDEALIGRRSDSSGVYPEVDLTGATDDPGVSRRHALLRRTASAWEVIDQGSTNGTRVNGAADAIPASQPVPLADGDHVHVGAWTRLTVRRAPGGTTA